jgi:adenine deaminase
VVAIGAGYEGCVERDLGGRYLVPGLIDGHMHLESTMMVLGELARTVVPHGTTTVVLDPHEFANVLGVAGMRYVMDSVRPRAPRRYRAACRSSTRRKKK